ncbi:MAG: D-alanyl-D-alanine carboxypeptidase/D-alanyl-D-alanine-endopeptidase [Burkholderiaceae bacterium]
MLHHRPRIHARAAAAVLLRALPASWVCAWRLFVCLAAAYPMGIAHAQSGPLSGAQAGAPLPPPALEDWLLANGLSHAAPGFEVRDLASGRLLYARNAGRAINPGSLMKLLPVTAALRVLGPDFRWHTAFYPSVPIIDGRLRGDLIMRGDGDPKLVIEDLTELIARMRAQGLHEIAGDLVIDDGLFSLPPPGPAFDGQPNEPYNVYPSAGLLNFKSTEFQFTPHRRGVDIVLDPPLAGVTIRNRMRLRDGSCRDGANGARLAQRGTDARPEIVVSGYYARRCGRRSAYFAVLDHRQFAEAFFRAAWEAAGGVWSGHARYRRDALAALPAAQRAAPWLVWESPRDLAAVVADIHKFSNNVMARMLMLRLGAERRGPGIDEAGAREVVLAELAGAGFDVGEVRLDNGSGLSRDARLTPRLLGDLLVRAPGPPPGGLAASLPIVGEDGTMRWRLRQSPVAGNAWIKTGSLDGVRAIAGYVRGRSGRVYTLVFIVNDPNARAALGVQDRLLEWLHDAG